MTSLSFQAYSTLIFALNNFGTAEDEPFYRFRTLRHPWPKEAALSNVSTSVDVDFSVSLRAELVLFTFVQLNSLFLPLTFSPAEFNPSENCHNVVVNFYSRRVESGRRSADSSWVSTSSVDAFQTVASSSASEFHVWSRKTAQIKKEIKTRWMSMNDPN